MNLSNIVKIKKISSEEEANTLLMQGWVLLSSGFNRGEKPGYDHHSYSLRLPKELADSFQDQEDEPEYDFGF